MYKTFIEIVIVSNGACLKKAVVARSHISYIVKMTLFVLMQS